MTVLVADVGGTNTRMALVGPAAPVRDVARFENDAYPSFYAVLEQFLQTTGQQPVTGCCVAIAGPVTAEQARLTNRDWEFDATDIASRLPDPLLRVQLINDLAALGHALPLLNNEQLSSVKPARSGASSNGQALVAGLGTGFNVCLVKSGCASPVVIEAEMGHASLPGSVLDQLQAAIGGAVEQFDTVEALFSGRGLARLFSIQSSGAKRSGPDILDNYDRNRRTQNSQTVELMARLLGVFSRELVFQYQPFGGIHFAGGAARGILGSDARADFIAAFEADGPFSDHIANVPVRVICDDAAALTGAAFVALKTVSIVQ